MVKPSLIFPHGSAPRHQTRTLLPAPRITNPNPNTKIIINNNKKPWIELEHGMVLRLEATRPNPPMLLMPPRIKPIQRKQSNQTVSHSQEEIKCH